VFTKYSTVFSKFGLSFYQAITVYVATEQSIG
jgi:hypothetical protein